MEVFGSGLVAGYGIAVPVGAIGTYLVVLTARTSFLVGGSAALGVASADGLYALVAVLGGTVVAAAVGGLAGPLQWVSLAVLLVLAIRTGAVSVREYVRPHAVARREVVRSPVRAYVVLLAATLLNPATVVYFTALVLANRAGAASSAVDGTLFVLGAFLASASWQLLLAGSGAALGRFLTGRIGRLLTGLLSAVLIGALALWMVLG